MALDGIRAALFTAEKPRRFATGEHRASPLDWSSSTLREETHPAEQFGSPVVDWALPHVAGVNARRR